VQGPLRLSAYNEPVPDLVLLKPRIDFYESARPSAEDSLLVIEVSASSLAIDVRIKAPLYAAYAVQELWVVDLPSKALRRFATAQNGLWTDMSVLPVAGVMSLPSLPGLTVDLTSIW